MNIKLLKETFKTEEVILEEIESEEESLIRQLELIKNRKKDIERELKKKIPVIARFRSCSYGSVTFEVDQNKRNPRFFEILKSFNPIYDGQTIELISNYPSYYININSYQEFEETVLREIPNTQFINFEYLKKPFWRITKQDKQIAVQWNPVTNQNGQFKELKNNNNETLLNIPGLYRKEKYYTIPLSEGWRLYSIHPEIKSELCEWTDVELVEEVRKEFEKRLRVKQIHTAEDSDYDQSFDNLPDFKLRAHQRVALEFADLVDHKTLVSYGTGTGKTAVSIADALKVNAQRIVVVCPGALRANWRYHIHKHTGYDPLILAGRVPTKYDMRYIMKEHPRWIIINYDILRTNTEIENNKGDLRQSEDYYPWVELINLYNPDYVIVDECHYMKNPSSSQSKAVRQLQSDRKMALSATPIMNRPGELWSILNWLYPDIFKYYETFLNQYGWGRYINAGDAQKLRSLLETIMIRRTRQDISKNLPPINRIVETFEMSSRARKIYDRILLGIYKEMAEYDHTGVGGQERRFKSILPKINAMIKVCAADKVRYTVERAIELADAIEEDQWNKILIFTHFKGTCNTIARKLGHQALSFVQRTNQGFHTLDMPERMELVEQFQTDPSIKYLVVTRGSASEGLDITKAGIVLFNDLFWNPAAHIQCEGRAFYRESDMHGGDAYYYTMIDSIEEWLTELQGIKDDTVQKVIEGKNVEGSITNKIIERLRELFKNRMKEKS